MTISTVGLLGAGFMGSALARAVASTPSVTVAIYDPDGTRASTLAATLPNARAVATPEHLRDVDALIIAVKPQDLAAATPPFADPPPIAAPVISCLAGTPIATLRDHFPGRPIVRIMPNLAADVGRAATAISFDESMDDDARRAIQSLLSPIGALFPVKERLMSAMTGLSGSGIAFVWQFIDAMAMGGVHAGVPYPQALEVVREVVTGAVALLEAHSVHPREMVSRVCSPNGTTIRGVHALADGRFDATVAAAVVAAAERADEFEQG